MAIIDLAAGVQAATKKAVYIDHEGKPIPLGNIGALGHLKFVCSSKRVLTPSDVSRSLSTNWAQHKVIGGHPVLEWVSHESSSVSLTMRFDIWLGVEPRKALERLKKMMENKLYKSLIIGDDYLGRFVITDIEEDRKAFDGHGNCIVAEATVTLLEWRK